MRTIFLGLLAVAGIAIAAPIVLPASAQVTIETPAGDVRVGHLTATVTATTDVALSPSAATTELSVELGAATEYHRRTTARVTSLIVRDPSKASSRARQL